MKQLLTITFYLFVCLNSTGQTTLSNTLTPKHQNIKGTKISLIPPKGFDNASNFLGLQQNESGSTIMIIDLPAPFSEISKAFTKETFLTKGIVAKEIEHLTFNNLPALFVTAEQNAYGKTFSKFMLVFGSEKEIMMINGAFPNNLQEIGEEIKTSILSSYYDANKKINPFENIDYEIDVSSSKLIFASGMANSLTFTSDGKSPTQSNDKTYLIVAKSFGQMEIADKKLFSLNRLKQLPMEFVKTESIQEISIDGIAGYEVIATVKDKKTGALEKTYQTILFSDNLYYILSGGTNNDFDNNINAIRNVVKTFKRK